MSLAARRSEVLFEAEAPIQEQALAAQRYGADQPGTGLESEWEPG